MKHLLLFVIGFIFTGSLFSQHVDTLTEYQYVSNVAQPETRLIYTYDASCRVSELRIQKWQTGSSAWADTFRTTYTYNANNQVNQATNQEWNTTSSSWVNVTRTTNSYDANNQVSQVITEVWQTNTWTNASRQTYSYINTNLVDSLLTEGWDTGTNTWTNVALTTNTYNGDNTLHQTVSYFWTGSWTNTSRITFTYNADKTVKESIAEAFDFIITQTWSNTLRNAYTYNASKLQVTDTTQTWDGAQWNDSSLSINTYVGTVLSTTLNQSWNGTSWENEARTNYTYNGDGTIAEIVGQDWNGTAWVNDTRITYHYSATCTLPLTLLNFSAALNGKAAQLQWTTTTEINTKNFIVQRSVDGIHFSSIGTVNAAGNSTQKTSYKFDDASALNAGANKLYYRLQMVDKDGKFTFSKIAIVEIVNGKLFVIYPNPAKDVLFIKTNGSLNNTEIRINDQSGKVVLKQQMTNMQAGTPNKVNVGGLNKGVYYLQLITGSDVQTTKFFKY